MESKIKDLRQLIFNFGHNKSFQKNDFFISESNYFAYELLMSWPKWEKKLINIYGAKSSGKTHLLEIFKQKNRAIKFEANNFSEDDLDKTNLEQNIILENLDNNFDENVIYTLIDLLEKQITSLSTIAGHKVVESWLLMAKNKEFYELVKQLMEKHYDPRYKRSLLRKKKEVFAKLKIEDMSQKGLSSMVDRILQTAKKIE